MLMKHSQLLDARKEVTDLHGHYQCLYVCNQFAWFKNSKLYK